MGEQGRWGGIRVGGSADGGGGGVKPGNLIYCLECSAVTSHRDGASVF